MVRGGGQTDRQTMYHRSFPPLPEAQAAVASPRAPAAPPRRVLLAADLQQRLRLLAARRQAAAAPPAPAVSRPQRPDAGLSDIRPPDPRPDACAPPSGQSARYAPPSPAPAPHPEPAPEPAVAGPRRVTAPPPPRTIAALPPTALPGSPAPEPLLLTGAERSLPRRLEEALCSDTFDFDFTALRRG